MVWCRVQTSGGPKERQSWGRMYLEGVLRLYSVQVELEVLLRVGIAVGSEARLEVARRKRRGR